MSLQQICVNLVCNNIDCVEAFGDVADAVKDSICQLLCRHRKLDNRVLRLFLGPEVEHLRLYDCAEVDEQGLLSISLSCPILTTLHLHQCSRMSDEVGDETERGWGRTRTSPPTPHTPHPYHHHHHPHAPMLARLLPLWVQHTLRYTHHQKILLYYKQSASARALANRYRYA